VQEIEMLQPRKRRLLAGHPIARLEQRLVEALAVIRDQDFESLQKLRHRRQLRFLLSVVAHEELADTESAGCDVADPDQECIGA